MNQPEWVRAGDAEGWMNPRNNGGFEFHLLKPGMDTDEAIDQAARNGEDVTTDADYGPATSPGDLDMRVWDDPVDPDADADTGWHKSSTNHFRMVCPKKRVFSMRSPASRSVN